MMIAGAVGGGVTHMTSALPMNGGVLLAILSAASGGDRDRAEGVVNVWTAMVLAGVGCFALRFGVVMLVDRRPLPAWFELTTAAVARHGSISGVDVGV